ncbi:MAG: glycine--tRNA ligase subunit beta [Candidatus Omnitrophica bacterium]|nr:glycine--tRNA ligase subunit beta [Candidatus Omnitrophota bacterium]
MKTPKQAKKIRTELRTDDFLLEIGTEELPAAYLPELIRQLREEGGTAFRDNHLTCAQVESFGTPRRLVLVVRGLAAMQHKPAEKIRGPSQQMAYDAEGQPTKALLGFLRSRSGTLAQTQLEPSDKGSYVYLLIPPRDVPTPAVLPQVVSEIVLSLRSPKTMRWDASGGRFARPIRWLLALYESRPIRCTVGRLASGAATWVDGPLHPRAVPIPSTARYFAVLKTHRIMLDQEERRLWIERAVAHAAQQAGGSLAPEMLSHGLLDEVTFLVERPTVLVGAFDPNHLALPREVLLASMAKYQRVFAVESAQTLLPTFAAVLDGSPKRPAHVRRVIERILNARLADSSAFLKEDRGHLPLERMASGLSGVTFHERLGSMADKTLRLRGLCEPLADAWRLTDEERSQLRRACALAKADLVSTMVKEFPTLQGVIGKYYARDSGELSPVAEAIEEHYLPIGTRLPKTLIGGALSILDKYDTLTGYFGLGIEPTGDQDPFGLRRAAQGIMEVAWTIHRPLPLDQLLRVRGSLAPFLNAPPKTIADVGLRIARYLFERLSTFAWPPPAPAADCIAAVLASPCDDLIDIMDRVVSLQRLSGQDGLLKAAKVVERTHNILKGAPLRQPQVDPSRLREPLERRLWDLYAAHQEEIGRLAQDRSYSEATTRFGDVFFEPIHEFFEHVLVNVPEESLQQNRLALMKAINALYTEQIADLSKLTILHRGETA